MTASEGSYIGLAPQSGKGIPVGAGEDELYDYLLLLESALGVNNVNLPLDREVGGGAFGRSVVKAGVTSGGAMRFIPRPKSIGQFLLAFFGSESAATEGTLDDLGTYEHVFSFGSSQFSVPYYTLRNSPGGMFGHQYQDCRLMALSFDFRAADFVRASAGFIGGVPEEVSTATWAPNTHLDEGPQFLSVLSKIEIPDGTGWKVLQGSLALQSAIPLDQQWVVGSYSPDDFSISARSAVMNLVVKVDDDGVLYNKMSLDPAGGSAWTADLLKEGSIDLEFVSNEPANPSTPTSRPHSMKFEANGDSGMPNVVFQVAPLAVVPGRQIVMNVTGTFLADPTAGDNPLSATLINGYGSTYSYMVT